MGALPHTAWIRGSFKRLQTRGSGAQFLLKARLGLGTH